MTLHAMADASTPPQPPPNVYCIAGYIGGDTPYVWTPDDWADQVATHRLPIFTASNREDTDAAGALDAGTILREMTALHIGYGNTVAIDIETRVYSNYLRTLNAHLPQFHVMTYGSVSTLVQNPRTSGGWWGAHWTDNIETAILAIESGEFHALQWASDVQLGKPYDLSLIDSWVPLWHV